MGTTIRVAPTLEETSRLAALLFVRCGQQAVAARGRFVVGLSGGSTPGILYSLLAQPPFTGQIEWGKAHFFWGDERCVRPEDPLSNYRMAEQQLLSHVPVPPQNVHRAPVELGNPKAIAEVYERTLRQFFRAEPPALPKFDLVLLGLGADGHTASLFPGSNLLQEQTRLVAPVPVKGPNPARVTFTMPVINQARTVAFLVAGADKAASLSAVLAGDTRLPGALVRPLRGELYWFVDFPARGRTS